MPWYASADVSWNQFSMHHYDYERVACVNGTVETSEFCFERENTFALHSRLPGNKHGSGQSPVGSGKEVFQEARTST